MSTKRIIWLGALALAVAVGSGVYWYVGQPRDFSIPIGAKIHLDKSTLGEVAFNADKFVADDIAVALAPGRYAIDTPGGRWTLGVTGDTAITGRIGVHVADRGEDDVRRWVKLEADDSQLTFKPAIQIVNPHGVSVNIHDLSAGGSAASAKVEPLVARSLATFVVSQVWSAPENENGVRPANPIREVKVAAGLFTLRDGAKITLGAKKADESSMLVVQPGSQVKVRDLNVTGRGVMTSGQLSVAVSLGPDSHFHAGKNKIGVGSVELRGKVDIASRGEAIEFDGITVSVPKQQLVATLGSAIPKTITLKDQPLTDKSLLVFRKIHLAELQIEPEAPEFDFVGEQIAFSGRPLVRGTFKAERLDVEMRKPDDKGGIKLSIPKTNWVPIQQKLAVPVALTGKATVELVAGNSLLDTKIRLTTDCDSVVVGEPTIDGLPEALKPLTKLVAELLNKLPVQDKTLPDYLKELASRQELLPLFGSKQSPETAAILGRMTLKSFTYKIVGDDVVFTGQVTLRTP